MVNKSPGAKESVVALIIGPRVPQRFLALKDEKATYIEGETLSASQQDISRGP
jgi:hypothetical protein